MIESHPYIAVVIIGTVCLMAGTFIGLLIAGLCRMAKDADESETDSGSVRQQLWQNKRTWAQQ